MKPVGRSTVDVSAHGLGAMIFARCASSLVVLWAVQVRHFPYLAAALCFAFGTGFVELGVGVVLNYLGLGRRVGEDELAYEERIDTLQAVLVREVWPPSRLAALLAELPAASSPRQRYEALRDLAAREVPDPGMTNAMARELYDAAQAVFEATSDVSEAKFNEYLAALARQRAVVEAVQAYRRATSRD